jgi:hypothetical protein
VRLHDINKLVEDYIGTNGGYLSHFTYSKHDRFYHAYCNLDVDVPAYRQKGHTTRTAFIQILKDSQPRDQARIIRGVFKMLPPPRQAHDDKSENRIRVHQELLELATRLEADGEVAAPVIEVTSEVVFVALKDAETLLRDRGAKSAVDRAHTALHGYLKKVCIDRSVVVPSDASITVLFKAIREQFHEFKDSVAHDSEAKRLFGSMATALDSLNTIRNRGTLAHPNDLLLEEAEAMLYINVSRAALGYLESKLKKP